MGTQKIEYKFTEEQFDRLFDLNNKGLIKLYMFLLRYKTITDKTLDLNILIEDLKANTFKEPNRTHLLRNLKALAKADLIEFNTQFINKTKTTLITKVNEL